MSKSEQEKCVLAKPTESTEMTALLPLLAPVQSSVKRMFKYFARLHEKYDLPVYPVAVFSYDEPYRTEPDKYQVTFPDLGVLSFRFRVVQLNRLDWHDFVERMNPVAAALMAKMRCQPPERPDLKLACLRLLGNLQLDPARGALISGFIDAYLQLTMDEEAQFNQKLTQIEAEQQEKVMEIVTSWMKKGREEGLEQGLEQGRELGRQQEACAFAVRLLRKRLGSVSEETEARVAGLSVAQLEDLGEALLDFSSTADLEKWLRAQS